MRTLGRRLRAAWMALTGTGAAATVAFGLLVFVSVLASLTIPRESAGLRNSALKHVIAASSPGDRTVVGTVSLVDLSGIPGQVLPANIATYGAQVRSRLAAGGLPIASKSTWAGMTTGFVPVTGAAQPAGHGQPKIEMTYRTALARYSHVVAGRLPAGGSLTGHQAVVEVAATTTTAARLGLRVGARLSAGPVRLVITGIIRPALPASAFWTEDPTTTRPALAQPAPPQQPYWTGALFFGPGALPLAESFLNPNLIQVTWVYQAALGQLTADQASGVEASVTGLVSTGAPLTVPGSAVPVIVTMTSQIPSILSPFITADRAVAPVLELLYVSLAVMGAVVLLLGARLVAERRAAEFALMRARGASLRQLSWLMLRASGIIGVSAAAAAAVLAIKLTSGDGDQVSWWLAGFTVAVTLAGPVLVIVARHHVPARVASRPESRARGLKPAIRRIVTETALTAAAIGGLLVLRDQGLTSGSKTLYPSAAPVLIAVPVAVIMLRCYPAAARGLARLVGHLRGVAVFVGLARATRTPPGAALPAFALVLVLTMVAFPAMISTSVTRAQETASWQQVGADAIIAAPSDAVISSALQRQVSSVPGVVSTATAVTDAGALPASGGELTAVFVNPAPYAAIADRAPGAQFPLAALSRRGPAAGATVPAVATAAAAQLLGPAPTSINLGASTITIRLAGRIGGVPGVAGNAVAVMPLSALGPNPPGPNLLLIAGPGLDAARLAAAVHRALPGGSLTLRSTVLAALTTAPVPQAAQTALAQGMATAAGFGALILLLSLLLTAQTRDMTLSRLATMGLPRWQAELLLATETLPQVLAAAVGGIACAWLLAPLIGPSIDLSAFSEAGPGIVVSPAPFPLAASAAGLVLGALLVLAAQAVITYRRGSDRAMRIAD